eukprot:TRINITY_DN7691_c0_g1_i2.p1 TRINITY_DN7691_c0_g1~~TRINITY_DN7691_c0_g1_i2.p1  ORF type:complete len:382 (+),score=18.69 TRINITY_DN7691_c0_g1_i2:735-1880(+)
MVGLLEGWRRSRRQIRQKEAAALQTSRSGRRRSRGDLVPKFHQDPFPIPHQDPPQVPKTLKTISSLNILKPPKKSSRGRPRQDELTLSQESMDVLTGEASVILQQALSKTTWSVLRSVHRRFTQFKKNWESQKGRQVSLVDALVIWLTKKLLIDETSPSTALQYSFDVVSAMARTETPFPTPRPQVILDFRRALARMGAIKDSVPATPITRDQLKSVLASKWDQTSLAIRLCWMSASRLSDVNRLEKEHVILKEGPAIQIDWTITKTDVYKLGTIQLVSVDIQTWRALKKLRASTKDSQPLFPEASYSRVSRMLKKLDSGLTPHSIKRGAIHALWESGLSLSEIQSITGHATMTALFRYLPRSATRTRADPTSLVPVLDLR